MSVFGRLGEKSAEACRRSKENAGAEGSLDGKCAARNASFGVFALVFFLLCTPASGIMSFDPENCNATHPCCTSADVVASIIGAASKSFCKIEYPVRTESNWEVAMLITKNNEAKRMLEELKRQGCGHEPCKGYVCAELFPRCFHISDLSQGEFLFDTCRETCEECYRSCTSDTRSLLLLLPLAVTSLSLFTFLCESPA